ncbi:MAG: EAL domain-containing protein [Betaproteobacteria bacterium]|nr:EAL domain-containing protein [Betaproteobacteria bacterium]
MTPVANQALSGRAAFAGADAMAAPLRGIAIAMAVFFALGAVVNLPAGRVLTGGACAAGTLAGLAAWAMVRRGASLQWSASLSFYAMALVVTALLWAGNGTRDYGLAGYPAVLFLGCVFLATAAYWGLAACVLVAVTLIAVAEINGLKPVPGPPTDFRALFNLWLIMGASAVGGRVLMQAVRSALTREQNLSGALKTSQERLSKLLSTSPNAIVVSRFSDGTYLEVNDAFLAMFGYTREEVVGRTSLQLGVWESAHERERFIAPLRDGEALRDFETRQRRKNGDWIELSLSAEHMDLDGVECLLISATDISARRAAERRAEFLSTRDALTGLPNRVLALDRLQQAMARARLSGGHVAVLHVDLDRFKAINDAVGRAQGDAVLRETCARLEHLLKEGDTLARIGGNEFLVVTPLAGQAEAKALGEAMLSAIDVPYDAGGRPLRVTTCIGVSLFPEDSPDAETLLLCADTAVHEAKAEGRARVCLYANVMGERVQDRLLVESSLRDSLTGGGLTLAYQPKFDVRSRTITGVEALARWNHAKLGSVPPSVFIAIAEESDLICDLGHWVLKEACAQIAQWRELGLPALPIAVNLSARQITPTLPAQLFSCARDRGVAPDMLELEVTETMLIARPESSRKVLEQVTRHGNRIVLDDFGVGYSSMAYVKLLHLNGIKIDRSFVADVVADRHDRAIVSAIVGLAHGLGLKVVAEGVETEDQLDALEELGCDEAQGFLLCRPISGERLASDILERGVGRR